MIFMDEMMPEVDGIAAMRQIRAISESYAKKTRIIVLTADAMSGAMEISQSAGEQEIAGKEGNYRKIDDHIDTLLISYKSFLDKLGKLLDMQDIELGEEWSPEEIRQVCRNIEKKIESFDFGAIFDILEKLESIPMGAETGRFFRKIDQSMNEMDIEKVKQLVKDTNGTKHTIAQER